MNRTPRTRSFAVLAALLVAVLLAACAASVPGAAAKPGTDAGTPRDVGGPLGEQPPGIGDGFGGEGGGTDPDTALADRKIIKTGEITIEVSDVVVALGKVRALALELDGYVGASQIGGPYPYPYPYEQGPDGVREDAPVFTGSASLTLRIPADRFDEAITRLHAFDGTVVTEATREDDVTAQLVDIEARLRNLEASEIQYRSLLEKAEKVEDILAVQVRLDEVRGQIEQWQAQQKELSELADLATLTVTLTVPAIQQATRTWDPGKTVSDAVAALVSFGQSVVNGAIWFTIVWLPALIVILILGLLGWRFLPKMRRPAPSAAPAADAAAAPEKQA